MIATAGDDHSTAEVRAYVDAVDTLKPEVPSVIIVIAPATAPRLDQLVELAGGARFSIGDPEDLQRAYSYLGSSTSHPLGSPCVPWTPADLDVDVPGEQHACSVWSTHRPGQSDEYQTVLRECVDGVVPCWRFTPDLANCPDANHLAFDMVWDEYPSSDVIVEGQCELAL